MARLWLFVWVLATGCSFLDDFSEFRVGAGSDASTPSDGSDGLDGSLPDGGEGGLCTRSEDGTPCGSGDGFVCIAGACRVSTCGDGYVDVVRGEECEDQNTWPGDGCEPRTCTYSCASSEQCNNGFVCDGEETCVEHVCKAGEQPTNDVACLRFDDVPGSCAGGYCVPVGCGDGMTGQGEACDGQPGCRPDCTMGCVEDGECIDSNVCDGIPRCTLATGECRMDPAPGCDDGDPCTIDRCHPLVGCTQTLDDADGDGFSAATCAPASTQSGGDCDDADRTRYPGATEYCDGLDNDCDDMVDENAVMATCYADADGDGFPMQQNPVIACVCPRGTMPERADHRWDCWDDPEDGGRDVYPGQTEFFAVGYNRRCRDQASPCDVVFDYDYDCDGTETPFFTQGNVSGCGALGGALGCSPSGYRGAAPACGASADYLTCTPNGGLLGGCSASTLPRAQTCR